MCLESLFASWITLQQVYRCSGLVWSFGLFQKLFPLFFLFRNSLWLSFLLSISNINGRFFFISTCRRTPTALSRTLTWVTCAYRRAALWRSTTPCAFLRGSGHKCASRSTLASALKRSTRVLVVTGLTSEIGYWISSGHIILIAIGILQLIRKSLWSCSGSCLQNHWTLNWNCKWIGTPNNPETQAT